MTKQQQTTFYQPFLINKEDYSLALSMLFTTEQKAIDMCKSLTHVKSGEFKFRVEMITVIE